MFIFLVGIFHSSCGLVKYPYSKTIHMISTEWSLTHLFLLYYLAYDISYLYSLWYLPIYLTYDIPLST